MPWVEIAKTKRREISYARDPGYLVSRFQRTFLIAPPPFPTVYRVGGVMLPPRP